MPRRLKEKNLHVLENTKKKELFAKTHRNLKWRKSPGHLVHFPTGRVHSRVFVWSNFIFVFLFAYLFIFVLFCFLRPHRSIWKFPR